MRRFFTIFAALFAFVGCSQDDVVTPNAPIEKPTYYASFADAEADSRTYLDENFMLLWHNDDRISLFATTYNEEYAFADATGSNSGAFNAVDKDSYVTGNAISTTYAVYPYNAANAISNSEILTIHFPAEQSYAEDSFGRGANTMVAAAQSSSSKLLPFRNAGGYMMLKLYGENKTVKSIELKGNNEEVISGAATAEAKYGYLPLITMGAEGGKSITLTCENAVELGATEAEATTFWIVVPPITFEQGFTITVTDADGGTYTKSTSKPTTITRNEIKSMSALAPTFTGETENPETPAKPANNEIWYTSTDGNIVEPYNTDVFGANIISNTYENGKGIITFDGEVTSIGESAFSYCRSLTSITIPNSVTEIGEKAFWSCDGLTSITIPNSVTEIGEKAFWSCDGLTSITIPDSVTEISSFAFYWCYGLTSVFCERTTPPTANFEGYSSWNAFGDNATDRKIYVPAESVDAYKAARGWKNYADAIVAGPAILPTNNEILYTSTDGNIVEPDKSSGFGANIISNTYENGKGIITFDGEVTKIGDWAFHNRSGLTSITIPDSVTKIGDDAFLACTGLTSVTIPDSVTEIGRFAFYYCSGLTSVTIPNSVTEIGYRAFYGCSDLTRVFCERTTPPTANFEGSSSWSAFNDNAADRKIYVPTESVDAYKSANGWKEYADSIEPYDF